MRTWRARLAIRMIDLAHRLRLIGTDRANRLAIKAARRLTRYRVLNQHGRQIGPWRRVEATHHANEERR